MLNAFKVYQPVAKFVLDVFKKWKFLRFFLIGYLFQGGETIRPDISGVVLEARSSSISVAFQDESEINTIKELDQCAIVKLADDITYRKNTNEIWRVFSKPNTAEDPFLSGF